MNILGIHCIRECNLNQRHDWGNMLFDIYSMQRQVKCIFATQNTYRTGTVRPHIIYSTKWQSRIHSTGNYTYKWCIYIKHLATLDIQEAWNTIWVHVCTRVNVSQAECWSNVVSGTVGCCVGWDAWNKLWPHLWQLKWCGAQRCFYYSFLLFSLSS